MPAKRLGTARFLYIITSRPRSVVLAMQYFKLLYDPNSFSEAHTMSSGSAYQSAYKMPDIGEIVTVPDFDAFVIEYNYKRANLVNTVALSSNSGLILDAQFFKILLEFSLDEYQVFPATVSYRKKDHPYHFLHFVADGNRFVDFMKCQLFLVGIQNDTGETSVSVSSYETYLKLDQQVKQATPPIRVWAGKLVFLENPDVDFFRLYRLRFEYFVSERLKNALEAANIKGIKFEVVE